MSNLNPLTGLCDCPMCGSPAELDATGTSECYGWAWQTLYVRCTDVKGAHCGMELSLQADMFYPHKDNNSILADCWNKLCQKQ